MFIKVFVNVVHFDEKKRIANRMYMSIYFCLKRRIVSFFFFY